MSAAGRASEHEEARQLTQFARCRMLVNREEKEKERERRRTVGESKQAS